MLKVLGYAAIALVVISIIATSPAEMRALGSLFIAVIAVCSDLNDPSHDIPAPPQSGHRPHPRSIPQLTARPSQGTVVLEQQLEPPLVAV